MLLQRSSVKTQTGCRIAARFDASATKNEYPLLLNPVYN